jgi:hypothetical protein
MLLEGDHFDTLTEHAIDDEEREPTQQEPPGVADVGRRGFGSLGDQLYGAIELASKTRCGGFVALPVPPLGGLGFVSGQRMTSTANRGISARRVGGALRPREAS